MGFICDNCNKEFKYLSKLNEHNNRKTNCNKNSELECNVCNIKFTCNFNKQKHEKTNKHIRNVNQYNLNNNINETIQTYNEKEQLIISIDNITNQNIELLKELEILKNKLKEQTIEIQSLKNENQILKLNNKYHENQEYIYIIHPAHCINNNIYKIGRTKNIINRFKQYPKGSELLFTITCLNSKNIEKDIIKYLKLDNKYKQYSELGLEYFQCNIEDLKDDIYKLVNDSKK
jgi:hypothetical protein